MSMCDKVIRKEIRWPFVAPDSGMTAMAVPGPPSPYGSRVRLDSSGAGTAFSVDGTTFTSDQIVQRMPIPGQSGLRGIAIAPDSPIHSCDIMMGGSAGASRFRISPGNPLIGDLDGYDVALLSLPVSIPVLSALNPSGAGFFWDASPISDGVSSQVWAVPLRLELWYGDIDTSSRAHWRSPLHATAIIRTLAANQPAQMMVCVDGRRRIQAQFVISTSATVSYSIEAITGINSTDRLDTATSKTLSTGLLATGLTIVDVSDTAGNSLFNPYSILRFGLVDSVGTAVIQRMLVHAWDE